MDSGLAGLVVAETVLSHSDGAHGIMWVRGHTLADLVANFGYEGAVALLWERFAGDGLDRAAIQARLGAARVAAFAALGEWLDRVGSRSVVEAARLSLAFLPTRRRRRRSSRHCRWLSPRCCAGAMALSRCRPTRASPPPPISCAWCTGARSIRRWSRRSTPIGPR